MRTRLPFILAVVMVLGGSACKKEFLPGETIEVVDTVSASNATTLTFSHGWSGSRLIGDENSDWDIIDTLGGLRIPLALRQGDRLIATLQVGLQQAGGFGSCVDSLHVSLGSVVGDAFEVTPDSSGVDAFEGGFAVDSVWEYGTSALIKQFVRHQEPVLDTDRPEAVVQTFVKLRSMTDDCAAGTVSCYVLNRSLTLTVIHP